MNPLRSLSEYELFIYTLLQAFPVIRRSTLVVIRRGAAAAVLRGELEFEHGIRLNVREKLSFAKVSGEIMEYGYEVWHGDEELYWYDSQAHPNTPSLKLNHPHHKHIPPDTANYAGTTASLHPNSASRNRTCRSSSRKLNVTYCHPHKQNKGI